MEQNNAHNVSKKRKKPYEVIPRQLLQAPEKDDMSLEALGLILNLKSYKDDWVIRKTELYHRYPFNKERSVRNAWNDLEKCNYAKTIKIREGSKYNYHYFYDIVPFDTNNFSIPEHGELTSFLGNQYALPNHSLRYNNRFEDEFELIPRTLLQSKDLSLGAIGLLCNLISYPETYTLKRKVLYGRFKKNKRVSICTFLDELIKAKYFVQFKIRIGKQNDYKYFYQDTPFTDEEIEELEAMIGVKASESFETGKRRKMETAFSTPEKKPSVKMETAFSTPQENPENQVVLRCRNRSVENEVSNLKCSKGRTNILHNNDNTHKDNTHKNNTHSFISFSDDDEEKIYKESKVIEIETLTKDFIQIICSDEKLKACAVFLDHYDLPFHDIYGICKRIKEENIFFTKDMIQKQLNITLETQRKNGMYNFVKYFVDGLIRQNDFIAAQKKNKKVYEMNTQEFAEYQLREQALAKAFGEVKKENNSKLELPLYNWLEK